MRRASLPVLAGLAALQFIAACSSSSTGGSTPAAATSAPAAATSAPGAATSAPAAAASAPAPAAGAQTVTVNLTDALQFQPATITVPRGGTVNWVNTGQTAHTVTDDPTKAVNTSDAALPSGAQPWDSGNLNGGASFSHTFDTPGQYTYFCIPHETLGMIGRITVTP